MTRCRLWNSLSQLPSANRKGRLSMANRRFVFDYDKWYRVLCMCIACKQQNESKKGEGLRRIVIINETRLKRLPAYHISLSCNHCQEPKCMEVCEQNAIKKTENGIVYLLSEVCSGCRKCIAACPYGAIKYNAETEKMIKCNMCLDNDERNRFVSEPVRWRR